MQTIQVHSTREQWPSLSKTHTPLRIMMKRFLDTRRTQDRSFLDAVSLRFPFESSPKNVGWHKDWQESGQNPCSSRDAVPFWAWFINITRASGWASPRLSPLERCRWDSEQAQHPGVRRNHSFWRGEFLCLLPSAWTRRSLVSHTGELSCQTPPVLNTFLLHSPLFFATDTSEKERLVVCKWCSNCECTLQKKRKQKKSRGK
ncbi:hypothetical protein VTK26DRAFT_4640 [Humicola hyalothermophila]